MGEVCLKDSEEEAWIKQGIYTKEFATCLLIQEVPERNSSC